MTSKYKAILFDMDGTLLDSMSYWRKINADFLTERGLEPPEELHADLMSVSNRVCATLYAQRYGLNMTVDDILAEYRARMGAYYTKNIEPRKGAKAYLRRLHERGIKVCVATATPKALAVPALERHGMLDTVEFVLSAFDEGMKKEEPYFYQLAASRLGVACEDCVMFEDALYAMRGAASAGMMVYGIAEPTQRKDEAEARALCEVFVQDFDELP